MKKLIALLLFIYSTGCFAQYPPERAFPENYPSLRVGDSLNVPFIANGTDTIIPIINSTTGKIDSISLSVFRNILASNYDLQYVTDQGAATSNKMSYTASQAPFTDLEIPDFGNVKSLVSDSLETVDLQEVLNNGSTYTGDSVISLNNDQKNLLLQILGPSDDSAATGRTPIYIKGFGRYYPNPDSSIAGYPTQSKFSPFNRGFAATFYGNNEDAGGVLIITGDNNDDEEALTLWSDYYREELFNVNSDGATYVRKNLGIDTVSPSEQLHITDNALIEDTVKTLNHKTSVEWEAAYDSILVRYTKNQVDSLVSDINPNSQPLAEQFFRRGRDSLTTFTELYNHVNTDIGRLLNSRNATTNRSAMQDASIVFSPAVYDTSDLYCVKPANGLADLDVTRATTATRVNAEGLIETVAANVPRIDYADGTAKLLVEPQRTNIITDNTTPSNWYNAGLTPTNLGAFDLNSTADWGKYTQSGTVNNFGIRFSTTNSIEYSVSTYFDTSESGDYLGLRVLSRGIAVIQISTGNIISGGDVVNSATVDDTKISNIKRVTFQVTGNGNYAFLQLPSSTGTPGVDDGNTATITAFQVEVGTYETSVIFTTGSTVTRNADVISKTGIADLLGDSEGFINIRASVFDTSENNTISMSDVTTSNRVMIEISDSIRAYTTVGGVEQATITGPIASPNQTYNIGYGYAENDFVLYVDGVNYGTDTTGSTFSSGTLTTWPFINGGAADDFSGEIEMMNNSLKRPSNAQIQYITTP